MKLRDKVQRQKKKENKEENLSYQRQHLLSVKTRNIASQKNLAPGHSRSDGGRPNLTWGKKKNWSYDPDFLFFIFLNSVWCFTHILQDV